MIIVRNIYNMTVASRINFAQQEYKFEFKQKKTELIYVIGTLKTNVESWDASTRKLRNAAILNSICGVVSLLLKISHSQSLSNSHMPNFQLMTSVDPSMTFRCS